VPIDASLCGLAARRRAPLIVEDLQAAPLPEAQPLRDEGVSCFAGFPLVAHGEVLGVPAFGSTTRSRFRDGDLQVIQTVCDQASAMLERSRLIEALHARERSLRLADRRKDDFIATLAHELRNPLAPIRNAVDILRRRGLEDPQLAWCRDVIQRQVTQMTHLLEDLLDVSRVTRNKIELRRERVALRRVIDDAIETTQPLIQAQRHTLSVELPTEPVVVYGDPTRLTQVLANLLNNAAKYTDPGGRIALQAHVDGDEVDIRVSDTGIGIEPAQLSRVFEMFSQLEPALERSRGGLGIGLSLSRGLVELHGGRLEAHSEGAGRGSTFTVSLPIVHAEPDVADDDGPARTAANSVRVLVVDDNTDAAQTLATMLELQGMDSRAAFGGRDGLVVAEQWRPEVVVVDIGMPDINGYEFVRRLREQPWGEPVLAIACTGWGQNEDRERARAAGFDHHLVKPIEPEAIAKIVARLDAGRGVSV
jgi:signal transduction histidine kinase/CheY-like chemotaxis protein